MVFEYMEYGDLAELLRKNDPILRKTDDCIVLQKVNVIYDFDTHVPQKCITVSVANASTLWVSN